MKKMILLKSRRTGSSYINGTRNPFNSIYDLETYMLRKEIYNYLGQYSQYVKTNYKRPLTEQENNTINTLLKTELIENLELAKQIILVKLNQNE